MKLMFIYNFVEKSLNYLATNGIQPVDGCLNHLIDSQNKEYRIPNFCINEPFMEKELHVKEEHREFHKIDVIILNLFI